MVVARARVGYLEMERVLKVAAGDASLRGCVKSFGLRPHINTRSAQPRYASYCVSAEGTPAEGKRLAARGCT